MKTPVVHIALISGGMYDRLYDRLHDFERAYGVAVTIGFRGSHPELNSHLADLAAGGNAIPYHLISTHTKYAPSHRGILAALQDFDTSDFTAAPLRLANIDGRLYGVPRNIDVKLLHYRTDLIGDPPRNWDELVRTAKALSKPPECYGFVFTGTGSGLFGMFLELTEMGGAHVFTGSLVPKLNNEGGRWALGVLRELYANGCVPLETLDWHFDEVHQCFRDGRAAMVCDWPGYYASYRDDSPVSGRFRVARLPAGPSGVHIAYAGCHTFALTCNAQSQPAALDLLRFLTAPEQQTMEARQGSVPVRASVMAEERSVSAGDILERLNLLETAIASDVIIPPPLARYPEVENIVWKTARSAILGQTSITAALEAMESGIARVLN